MCLKPHKPLECGTIVRKVTLYHRVLVTLVLLSGHSTGVQLGYLYKCPHGHPVYSNEIMLSSMVKKEDEQ